MQLPTSNKLKIPVSSEVKAFSVPLVSFIGVILIIIFIVIPMWNKVQQNQQQLEKSKTQLKSIKEKDVELKAVDMNELQQNFETAELSLPSAKEVPALLVGIYRLQQEQGLELVAMKIIPGNVATASAIPVVAAGAPAACSAPASKPDAPKTLEFNLVLAGSLEQARGFLMTLEKSKRLMVVSGFTFSSSSSSNAQISMKITAPYQPFPPLPKDFSEKLPKLDEISLSILNKLSQYTSLTTPFTPTSSVTGTSDPFRSSGSNPVIESEPTPTIPQASRSASLETTPTPTPTLILLPAR